MSYNIRNIREIASDPLTKFVNQLAKKISRSITDQQTEKLENKEDIYSAGQDIDVVVRYENFVSTKKFNYNDKYYSIFEPDENQLKVWIRGANMSSNTMRDYSLYGQTITVFGDPLLVDGSPLDLGIHTGGIKSTALRFNRPTSTTTQDVLEITNGNSVEAIDDLNAGTSFFMRFRVFDLAEQGGFSRTLYQKRDDTTELPDDGIRVLISPEGRVIARIRDGGVQYQRQTQSSNVIALNTVYDLWVSYNKTGNVIKIYVNGVDKPVSDPGPSNNWDSDETQLDWVIFAHPSTPVDNGKVYGDLYDFRIYRERIVSLSETQNMYTNKWSISNVPFGQVAVSNYCSSSELEQIGQGYTTTGYTTIGYDT